MKDQVENLRSHGIKNAFFYNSDLSADVRSRIEQACKSGLIKILYIAPESLCRTEFREFLSSIKVDLLAIDEAHCISTWGHDFRPEYLELPQVINLLLNPTVLALTATASPKVQTDIIQSLGIEMHKVIFSFDRSNLYLQSEFCDDNVDKNATMKALVATQKEVLVPGIIYCLTQASTVETAEALSETGLNVEFYHAGRTTQDKFALLDNFVADKYDFVASTIALGMGIDKKNIRSVIHNGFPHSIENYYQEIGRAGRDTSISANCICLFTAEDIEDTKRLLSSKWPSEHQVEQFISMLKSEVEVGIAINARRRFYGLDEIGINLILHKLEREGRITAHGWHCVNFKVLRNLIPSRLQTNSHIVNFASKRRCTIISLEEIAKSEHCLITNLIREIPEVKKSGLLILEKADIAYSKVFTINDSLLTVNIPEIASYFNNILQGKLQRVDALASILRGDTCIRKRLLEYFADPEAQKIENCGNCSVCRKKLSMAVQYNQQLLNHQEFRIVKERITLAPATDTPQATILKLSVVEQIPIKDAAKILSGTLDNRHAFYKKNMIAYGIMPNCSNIERIIEELIKKEDMVVDSNGNLMITRAGVRNLGMSI